MRTLFKHYIIETLTLYLVSSAVSGIIFKNGLSTMFLAGFALMIISVIVKPVIHILLLPINLVTFGVFKWVAVVIALYLVTLVVPGFEITNFSFAGYNSYWFYLPPIMITGVLAFVAFSFLISFVSSIISWVFK